MINFTLGQISQSLLASPQSLSPELQDLAFQGISIDTRTLVPGNLFIAISGAHFDGHDYIEEAAKKGAKAALVSYLLPAALPQIVVKDTTLALGQLAASWRERFNLPIVAVTGSNGKTTVKNMLAAIMTAACKGNAAEVLATVGTLNNHWGLPLTLARLNAQHRYAAIEMGMNHFNEIAYLTQLTKPQVAIITNAAASHLEGVGDLQGVAKAKAEIFLGLAEDGIAILNRDDTFFPFWVEKARQRPIFSFGFHPEADITLASAGGQENDMHIKTPKGDFSVHLPLLGKHNQLNALAAIAASLAIGIDLPAIKAGLEGIQAATGRLQQYRLANHVTIIDDTYNANPFSLQAAVGTLAAISGTKILVLGDMKELGDTAKALHEYSGEAIREAGINYLFTYGDCSAHASHAFGEGAYHFNDQEKLIVALKSFLHQPATLLIKGSRSMRMEKVVKELLGTEVGAVKE
jgi:UDP-N-acetylmuramoyl-tripeptide--D-alanyl-D-alanine ligase